MTTPLITRADDFGATPGSNNGILAALRGGAVRNVGLMACGPHLLHRLDELRDQASDLCLGLHACLTSEWGGLRWGPVLPPHEVPSLCLPDGSFPRSTQQLAEQAHPDPMMREVRAQLQSLRDLHLDIRYLDTHMVFTWVHDLDARLAAFCREEGLVYGHDPRFGRFNVPLCDPESPRSDTLLAALPEKGLPVWVFHPALPPDVATRRQREAERLADPTHVLALLHSAGLSPCAYA